MAQDTVEARIRERAHQIWDEAGRPDGNHQQHWEQAREQIEKEAEQKLLDDRKVSTTG